ncbi:tyrosine-type recombinase/integrase [Neorhizobium galegae]|uniref:tyrosine-type recombinase/integrase n=1 Tax=Neorhizobium galegae TaxID=399 RepID=UPI001AE78997|nr:site-specific integrase [Neorhizobium galegae]
MSTYKPKNSPYYHFDFQLGGHRFHGTTGKTSRREAEKVEKDEREKARKSVEAAKNADGGPLTINAAADRYWLEKGQLHANADTTSTDLARLIAYFMPDTLLSDISDAEVAKLVQWRRTQTAWGKAETADGKPMRFVSAATVNRSTTLVLKKLFTRAKRTWKYTFPNEPDWKEHFLPEPRERIREVHEHEGKAIDAKMRSDYEPIFAFARATGLRLDECLIEWSMVNWQTGWITRDGKGGRLVKTAITSTVRDILRPLIEHHPKFVFTYQAKRARKADASYKGDGQTRVRGQRYPVTYSGLKAQWKKLRKDAGLVDLKFHDFRHDVGTKLLRKTGNLKTVQKVLNHADLKTTTRYAHVLDEEVAAAMENLHSEQKRSKEAPKKSRTPKKGAA